MKTALFLFVAVALMLGACAIAQDQVNPLSVKLGLYMPSDDLAQDLGNTWFYGEVDYGFARNYDKNYEWHVQLGYTQKSETFDEGEEDELEVNARMIPLTVGIRYDQPMEQDATGYWYFGWGVGVYFANWEFNGDGDNETVLGGNVYAGYEFGNNFFIEGKYTMTGNFGDEGDEVNGNGLSAVVGVKLVK